MLKNHLTNLTIKNKYFDKQTHNLYAYYSVLHAINIFNCFHTTPYMYCYFVVYIKGTINYVSLTRSKRFK